MEFSLFDSVFFIWLAFLGIMVPIFTLGVSSMLHAIDKSKEKMEWEKTRIETTVNREIEALMIQLEQAKTGNLDKQRKKIERNIEKLKNRKNEFQKMVVAMLNRYETLNFKNSVLVPSIYFLSSILFGLYITLLTIPRTIEISFALSVFFCAFGIFRVLKSLLVMHDINRISEKYINERMKDSFMKSLVEDGDGTDE